MVTVTDCSVHVLHSITLGILIDSEQIGLLGLGWSVARYVAGIPVVWKDAELEDVGLLLNVCWESCWVSGYWNIAVRRCITVGGFVGLVVGI